MTWAVRKREGPACMQMSGSREVTHLHREMVVSMTGCLQITPRRAARVF